MLPRNDDDVRELAVEIVRVGSVDRIADRVDGGIGGGLTHDRFIVVIEGDDSVEISSVGGAVLNSD